MHPSTELQRALDEIQEKITAEEERLAQTEEKRSPLLAQLESVRREIEKYAKLNVFAFNSAKYDLQVLVPLLLDSMERRHEDLIKTVSVLKKGTAYFSISMGDIVFKDLMSFTCPTSLDKYMKTWLGYKSKEVSIGLILNLMIRCMI